VYTEGVFSDAKQLVSLVDLDDVFTCALTGEKCGTGERREDGEGGG